MKIVESLIKLLGFGKALNAISTLDGYKVYIAGTCKMLSGFAAILGAVAAFLPHLQGGCGLEGLMAAITGPELPTAKAAFLGGWYVCLDGFRDIGARHAQEKQTTKQGGDQ
jgi:hypothetical protein